MHWYQHRYSIFLSKSNRLQQQSWLSLFHSHFQIAATCVCTLYNMLQVNNYLIVFRLNSFNLQNVDSFLMNKQAGLQIIFSL